MEESEKLARFKLKIDLFKWSISSVALVVMTTIINAGFKDREVGLQEIVEYDKYIEMVVDNQLLEEKKNLSQFFALVTPSEKLRKGWHRYYTEVNKEYTAKLVAIKATEAKRLESFSQLPTDSFVIQNIQYQVKLHDLTNDVFSDDSKQLKSGLFETALKWERKGFELLLDKDLDKAITAFEMAESSYSKFHNAYDTYQYLKEKKRQNNTITNQTWQEIYAHMLKKFSWKMPIDIKISLEKAIIE